MSLKIPCSFEIKNRKVIKNYSLFLFMKSYSHNNFGKIDIRSIKIKSEYIFFKRALDRLLNLGWATKNDYIYSLRSFEHVWRRLEVKRYKIKKINKYKWTHSKLDIKLSSKSVEAVRQIVKSIEQFVCDRKINQIRYRANALIKRRRKYSFKISVPLSSSKVSKILGYKSDSSGQTKRPMLFELSKTPSVCIKIPTKRGYIYYNTCRTIRV